MENEILYTLQEINSGVSQNMELLSNIHTDLSAIASFLVFFVLVIVLYFGYKFFDMIWKF